MPSGPLLDGTVIDGEIVVLDADGCPDFAALMRSQGPPSFLVFDVLAVAGRDVCDQPLDDRKRRLTDVVSGLAGPVVQITDGIIGEGRALFEVVAARGMEGIVAKRLGSRYTPGRRSDSWVKIKVPGYAPDRWSEWFDGGAQREREPA